MDDADISDSENESDKYIVEDGNDIEEIVTVEFCPGNSGNCGNLGEWEKHTTVSYLTLYSPVSTYKFSLFVPKHFLQY